MFDTFLSTEMITWVVGVMAVCTTVLTTIALVAMAREGYRKD
jgi:hypothetical protein